MTETIWQWPENLERVVKQCRSQFGVSEEKLCEIYRALVNAGYDPNSRKFVAAMFGAATNGKSNCGKSHISAEVASVAQGGNPHRPGINVPRSSRKYTRVWMTGKVPKNISREVGKVSDSDLES